MNAFTSVPPGAEGRLPGRDYAGPGAGLGTSVTGGAEGGEAGGRGGVCGVGSGSPGVGGRGGSVGPGVGLGWGSGRGMVASPGTFEGEDAASTHGLRLRSSRGGSTVEVASHPRDLTEGLQSGRKALRSLRRC